MYIQREHKWSRSTLGMMLALYGQRKLTLCSYTYKCTFQSYSQNCINLLKKNTDSQIKTTLWTCEKIADKYNFFNWKNRVSRSGAERTETSHWHTMQYTLHPNFTLSSYTSTFHWMSATCFWPFCATPTYPVCCLKNFWITCIVLSHRYVWGDHHLK